MNYNDNIIAITAVQIMMLMMMMMIIIIIIIIIIMIIIIIIMIIIITTSSTSLDFIQRLLFEETTKEIKSKLGF